MIEERKSRAFWITAASRSELRTAVLPALREGEALVRALYSGVSRGTETLVYRHEVPASELRRMRAPHQQGTLPEPVKYGYASVGRVLEGPAALREREVFCLYPHQSEYVVDANALCLLPSDVPAARAVLAANMETAVNALWDAAPLVGQRVAVVGAGVVGCLVAYLLGKFPGAEVTLVDLHGDRAALAAKLGVAFALPADAPPERDLVVHASGSAAGLGTAFSLLRDEGTVLELSWYGVQSVALPLGEAFHARRLQLRSSQVGQVAPAMAARFTRQQRLALALSLLCDPVLDALISSEGSLEELPAVMAELSRPDCRSLCHRVRY